MQAHGLANNGAILPSFRTDDPTVNAGADAGFDIFSDLINGEDQHRGRLRRPGPR